MLYKKVYKFYQLDICDNYSYKLINKIHCLDRHINLDSEDKLLHKFDYHSVYIDHLGSLTNIFWCLYPHNKAEYI